VPVPVRKLLRELAGAALSDQPALFEDRAQELGAP
jgi:hypothetical protein